MGSGRAECIFGELGVGQRWGSVRVVGGAALGGVAVGTKWLVVAGTPGSTGMAVGELALIHRITNLWQSQRLVMIGAGLVVVSQRLSEQSLGLGETPLTGLGCLAVGGGEPLVQVVQEADGSYRAELKGEFQVRVSGDEPFRIRQLILFLRWLEVPELERTISRRTRDGRAPFVRQSQVAEWFGVAQPHVSRWEGYWLAGDWANLLSLKSAELLTAEVRAEIIEVCAAFPWWDAEQVHQYLRQQQRPITARQVRQTIQESGWASCGQT
jgi:Lon protease-like protein